MSRIALITNETANAEQAELFQGIQAKLGVVPNFLKVLANSPDALRAFLGLHHVAGAGSLDGLTRERIALAVAQENACEYCLSAHTAIGRKAGLEADEVTTAEIEAVRAAGYTDSDLVEIITHVGMNYLTNILGKASRVAIDFPKVTVA
jgi:AhpD family alkylhydroperoxidase